MILYLLIVVLLATFTPAMGQGTQLDPPGVKWGATGAQVPAPVQIVGYDSGTSLPCIIGATATCAVATTSGGGASTANQGTPAVVGNAWPIYAADSPGPLGAIADAAWSGTGNSTAIAALKAIYTNLAATVLGNGTAASAIRVAVATDSPPISFASPYPATATPLTASATGTTAATVATLGGTSGKTTYICGFSITSGATAGLAGAATVAGTITGTLNYIQGVAVSPAVGILNQTFSPCIPASAANTALVVTSAAAGVGGGTAVTAWGFQL